MSVWPTTWKMGERAKVAIILNMHISPFYTDVSMIINTDAYLIFHLTRQARGHMLSDPLSEEGW